MDDLRKRLAERARSGHLLEEVQSSLCNEDVEEDKLIDALSVLHTDGQIDIVQEFANLKNSEKQAYLFFEIRGVFEKLLPSLQAPIREVMDCVAALYNEAGNDGAAGFIFNAYQAFCQQEASIPVSALHEIEKAGASLDILTPTLVAGAEINAEYWLGEAYRLIDSTNVEIRRRAVFALGRMAWPSAPEALVTVLDRLRTVVDCNDDDETLSSAVRTIGRLLTNELFDDSRVCDVLSSALDKGGPLTLHAASDLFGFEGAKMPKLALDILMTRLRHVAPENTRTIEHIDFGIKRLLGTEDRELALDLLEAILIAHDSATDMEVFDSAAREIRSNGDLLNKVATRWLLNGHEALCEAVYSIVHVGGERRNVKIEVDASELGDGDGVWLIFAARKSIGFLFWYPVSAATFIVSLLEHAPDGETAAALEELLFEPLLINYPNEVRGVLEGAVDTVSKEVRKRLGNALQRLEDYLEDLRSIDKIPELMPSLEERESYHRHQQEEMTESYKAAEQKSVFANLFARVTLLYGRRSIHYVRGPGDEQKRMETPLTSHSVAMAFPRQLHLDPFGLEYMLRVMRVEKRRE